jgi:hypothetical protein
MTKSKTKPKAKSKSSTKASAAKTAVTKSSAAPATSASPLIVLGYDEHQKPRGARFVDAKPDLVAKAADLMDLKVYQATTADVAAVAKKLPIGRLYANGRGIRAEYTTRPLQPGPCYVGARTPGSAERGK